MRLTVQGEYHELTWVGDASYNPGFVGLIVFLVSVHWYSCDFGKEVLLRMNGFFQSSSHLEVFYKHTPGLRLAVSFPAYIFSDYLG